MPMVRGASEKKIKKIFPVDGDVRAPPAGAAGWEDGQGNSWVGGDQTTQVVVPGALKFLDVELAAMGVKLKYRVSREDEPRKGPLRPAPAALIAAK